MKQGTEVIIAVQPDCDMCKSQGYNPVRKARYDARMYTGQWAYLCTGHYREYRGSKELGTGKGQKLVVESEVKKVGQRVINGMTGEAVYKDER